MHSESLPYEPPIYPPEAAWEKIGKRSIVYKAWKKAAKLKGQIDIYIHIPFCKTICNFCGLSSGKLISPAGLDKYLDALNLEAGMYASSIFPRKITGIRIGGGTPSLFSAAQIRRLFGIVYKHFELEKNSRALSQGGIVFEANPEFLTLPKLKALKENNVNWIIMGVQSLDDNVIRLANRVQKAAHVKRAYENARKVGIKNIACDIMYGLNGQTEESFMGDIRTLASWRPNAVIVFGFTPTSRTSFSRHGGIITHERWRAIAATVKKGLRALESIGYNNVDDAEDYWRVLGGPEETNYTYTYDEKDDEGDWHSVLGLGAGALSVAYKNLRYQNTCALSDYMTKLKHGHLPVDRGATLTNEINMINYMVLSFVNCGGVSDKEFKREFGLSLKTKFKAKLEDLTSRGIIKHEKGRYTVNANRERVIFEISFAFFEDSVVERLRSKFNIK